MEVVSKAEFLDFFNKNFDNLCNQIKKLEDKIAELNGAEEYMKRSDVAKYLKYTWHQVASISYDRDTEKPQKRRTLPYHKVGGSLLYSKEEVFEYRSKIKETW
jgi:hypothetical protein